MVSKLRVLIIIAGCLGLVGAWPNTGKIYSGSSPATVAYVGPGDVVTNAYAWWGLRAYNNTVANAGATTTPVIDVVGSSTGSCTIYLKGDGTGDMDLTTAGAGGLGNQCLLGATTFCTVTNVSCNVSKFYDQSGNAIHLIQATALARPAFFLTGLSGKPIMTFNGTNSQVMASSLVLTSTAQPNTYLAVTEATLLTSNTGFLAQNGANSAGLFFQTGPNNAAIYCGTTTLTSAINTGTWYAMSGICNGGSSLIYVDGVGSSSGNAGTHQFAGGAAEIGANNGANFFYGNVVEGGAWGLGFSAGQASNMSANERAYWGF